MAELGSPDGDASDPSDATSPGGSASPQTAAAAAEAHRVDLARLLEDGRRLLAEDERLRVELSGGTVDAAAHRRLRDGLRAHRVALRRCQEERPEGAT